MEEKLKSVIEKVVRLSKQNQDFQVALQKELGISTPSAKVSFTDAKVSKIYELCVKEVLKNQAKEFYSDFPLKDLVPNLEDDYVRMESFRREDKFEDFCLAMYQQIECITNYLCENEVLNDIVSKMWAYPAYLKEEKGIPPSLRERVGNFCIASLVFPGNDKDKKLSNAIVKSEQTLQTLYAKDKMRVIVYFVGYRAMMLSSNYNYFIEINDLLSELYNCRNSNHRGNTLNEYEREIRNKIFPIKSFYYFKFMGALAQYVDYIKKGVPFDELKQYAEGLPNKKVKDVVKMPNVKIVGKIDLPDDGKRRFK